MQIERQVKHEAAPLVPVHHLAGQQDRFGWPGLRVFRKDVRHHAVGVEFDREADDGTGPQDRVNRAQQHALGDVPPAAAVKRREHGGDADVVAHAAFKEKAPRADGQCAEHPDREPDTARNARAGERDIQPAGELRALKQREECRKRRGQRIEYRADTLVGCGPHGVRAVHRVDVQPFEQQFPVGQADLLNDDLIIRQHGRRVEFADEIRRLGEFRARKGQNETDCDHCSPVAQELSLALLFNFSSFPHKIEFPLFKNSTNAVEF